MKFILYYTCMQIVSICDHVAILYQNTYMPLAAHRLLLLIGGGRGCNIIIRSSQQCYYLEPSIISLIRIPAGR